MRIILSMLMLAAILWSASLVWFVRSMPNDSAPASVKTDAIIVLTGGQGRVEHGLAMLADDAAPVLFISGVGQHVTLTQMLAKHADRAVRQKIVLNDPEIIFDYVASSTESNAGQASAFIRERHIRSIRLITANYHMPRSRVEFEAAIPGVKIISDPVFPDEFRLDQWWRHDNTRRLIFSEYYKYFGAIFRQQLA